MRAEFKRVIPVALAAISLASGARAADPGAAGQAIAFEVARLREVVRKLPDAIVGADERRQIQQQLATLDDMLQAGRVEAALHGLLRAARYVDAQAFRASKLVEVKEGMPALEREYPRYDAERRRQLESSAKAGPARSVLARALSESAAYESRIVHEACLVYGAQVGAESGYFYLGEARALLAFAQFARRLQAAETRPTPALGPLGPRLAELEQRLIDAYAGNTASPQASAFARANGALKLARELDREQARWGALYQYLLAEQALGQARVPAATTGEVPLRGAADQAARRIASSKTDHTLALAFLQAAQNGLAAADPTPALPNAHAILEQVLPAYWKIAGEGSR